jgi:hypothetical protein
LLLLLSQSVRATDTLLCLAYLLFYVVQEESMPCTFFGPIRLSDTQSIAAWQTNCIANGQHPRWTGPWRESGHNDVMHTYCCDAATDIPPDALQATNPLLLGFRPHPIHPEIPSVPDCINELTTRTSIELIRHGLNQDEAESDARRFLDVNIEKLLQPHHGSEGTIAVKHQGLCRGDADCRLDYIIVDVTTETLKPPSETLRYHIPTDGSWRFTFEVWWGYFCVKSA